MERIDDVTGTFSMQLETSNTHQPGSIFLTASNGLIAEFERSAIVTYMKEVFGLVDPLELAMEVVAPAGRPEVVALPDGCNGCPIAPAIMELLGIPAT